MRTNFDFHDRYIRMTRGDTLSFGIEIVDEYGLPFKQDLDRATFSCKNSRTDSRFLFKKTLGDGISKVGEGQYAVRIAPRDTSSAKAGRYFYDLEICANGDVFTIMKGVLELEQDVTY